MPTLQDKDQDRFNLAQDDVDRRFEDIASNPDNADLAAMDGDDQEPDMESGEQTAARRSGQDYDPDDGSERSGIKSAAATRKRSSRAPAAAGTGGEAAANGKGKGRFARLKSLGHKRPFQIGVGVIGATGGIMTLYLFFAQAFGPLMFWNGIDIDIEIGERSRIRRTVRLMRDLRKYKIDEVRGRKAAGEYRGGRVRKRFDKMLLDYDKFIVKAESAGFKVHHDPITLESGHKLNVNGARQVATAIEYPDGRVVPLNALEGNADDVVVFKAVNDMFKKTHSNRVSAWIHRAFGRKIVLEHTGFQWHRFHGQRIRQAFADVRTRFFRFQTRTTGDPNISVDSRRATEGLDQADDETARRIGQGADELDDAAREIEDALKKGSSLDGAINRIGMARFSGAIKKGSVIFMLATVGCLAKSVYDGDVQAKFERFASTIALASTFAEIAHELATGGSIPLDEIGDDMHDLQQEVMYVDEGGNTQTKVASFADTEAWQRAEGAKVITGEPMTPTLRVNGGDHNNLVHRFFSGLGNVISGIPDLVCRAVGGIWGQLFDAVSTVFECVGTLLIGCAAKTAGGYIAGEKLGALLATSLQGQIGAIATNVADRVGQVAQGVSAMNSMVTQSGTPISASAFNAERTAFLQQERLDNQQRPLLERYFAVDVKGSLGRHMAISAGKFSVMSTASKLGYIAKLPMSGFGSLLGTTGQAWAHPGCDNDEMLVVDTCEPFDNYGFQKYTYDTDLLDTDFVEHEQFAMKLLNAEPSAVATYKGMQLAVHAPSVDPPPGSHTVFAQGPSTPLDRDDLQASTVKAKDIADKAKEFAAKCMGMRYVPDPEDPVIELDPSLMLAMRHDPKIYGSRTDDLDAEYKRLCIDEANANKHLYSIVGRWVDDVQQTEALVSMMSEPVAQQSVGDGTGGAAPLNLPNGNGKELAQKVLDDQKITYDSARVREAFVQTSQSGTAGLCENTGTRVPVNDKLLAVILQIRVQFPNTPLRISSLTTGEHGKGCGTSSHHYEGRAVDIGNDEIAPTIIPWMYANKDVLGLDELFIRPMPAPAKPLKGGIDCACSNAQSSHGDHIHFSVKP